MRFHVVLAAFGVLSASLAARADVASDTFQGTFSSPLQGSVIDVFAPFVGGSGGQIANTFSYQITNNQVILTDLGATGILSGPFTGFQFTDVSGDPMFTGLTLDASSTITGGTGTFTTDGFTFNFAGEAVTLGSTAVYDFTTAAPSSVTPEPSSIALLGTGFLGLAGIVRRRRA